MGRSGDSNAAIGVALTCLVHPASLGAVCCLLVNDHVLKGRAPALLTGKLSDFAGLFFFPLLMALALGVSRAEPERVRRWAFGLTAGWFAAAKATILGHDVTLAAVELLVGPSVIEPDATDLVALLSLVPAWWLWSRCAHAVRPSHRARVFATMLAAVACAATPATGPRLKDFNSPAVLRVAVDGATVTAIVGRAMSTEGEGCALFRREKAAVWTPMGPSACPENNIGVGHAEVAGAGGVRLRLAGEEDAPSRHDDPWREHGFGPPAIRVVESRDGGATWTTAWEISPTAFVAASLVPDRHPRPDLRLTDVAASAESGLVAVAFRTEGALVREPGGAWSQEEVGPVTPLASTRTASVVVAKLGDVKWSALGVLWLSLGALVPAAWLVTGRRQSKVIARVAYAATYLVALGAVLISALRYSTGNHSPPTSLQKLLFTSITVALVLLALSPIVGVVELIRRRIAQTVSWPVRLRPSLAFGASLAALVLQTALPFAGLGIKSDLPELFYVCTAFAAQAFLGWREASARG